MIEAKEHIVKSPQISFIGVAYLQKKNPYKKCKSHLPIAFFSCPLLIFCGLPQFIWITLVLSLSEKDCGIIGLLESKVVK